MATTLTFYDGRDDERILQLKEDGENLTEAQYGNLTKVELLCRGMDSSLTTLSSDDVDHDITIDGSNQRLVLELGLTDVLEAGSYEVRVVGYTGTDPNGLVYADYNDLQIVKKA